jgi:hypothetical protein
MHLIAKYSSDPIQSHGKAILYLICYLKKAGDFRLKFKPDSKRGFECYCDTYFSGNWTKEFRWIIFLDDPLYYVKVSLTIFKI